MEVIKAEFSREFYESLPKDLRKEIVIRSVENEDFREDQEWLELRDQSNKSFKALKKREFYLREHLKL